MAPKSNVVTIKRPPRKKKKVLFDQLHVDIILTADADAANEKRLRRFIKGLGVSIARMIRLKLILQKLGHLNISVEVKK